MGLKYAKPKSSKGVCFKSSLGLNVGNNYVYAVSDWLFADNRKSHAFLAVPNKLISRFQLFFLRKR